MAHCCAPVLRQEDCLDNQPNTKHCTRLMLASLTGERNHVQHFEGAPVSKHHVSLNIMWTPHPAHCPATMAVPSQQVWSCRDVTDVGSADISVEAVRHKSKRPASTGEALTLPNLVTSTGRKGKGRFRRKNGGHR